MASAFRILGEGQLSLTKFLLLFYVIMVAVSPAILEVIRRGYGWAAALLSLAHDLRRRRLRRATPA